MSAGSLAIERELGVSREEAVLVNTLRCWPSHAPVTYSLASFAHVFGRSLGVAFTLSQLELSLVSPTVRPLCVAVLLRLLASGPPRLDSDSVAAPLSVPATWEEQLAQLLEVEEGVTAEESWLGCADPLGGCSFFDASPAQRLALLAALAERLLQDSEFGLEAPPPPPGPLANAIWHGLPLCESGGNRWFAVPGEPRLWCVPRRAGLAGPPDRRRRREKAVTGDKRGEGAWEVVAWNEAALKKEASRLAAETEAPLRSLAASLTRGVLDKLAAAREAAKEAAAEAAAVTTAEAEAILLRGSRAASLRSVGREEVEKREEEQSRLLRALAARKLEAAEQRRARLRALVPQRLRDAQGEWERRLSEAAREAGEPAWQAAPKGAEAVGRSLSVWWTAEKEFFCGDVTGWDEASGKHTVTFWDGDVDSYMLAHELVAWH